VALPKRRATLTASVCGRRSFCTSYAMCSAEEGELTFSLWVAVRHAAGRRGKHERE